MLKRLLDGLSAGIFLMAFLYLGSTNLLQQYFFSHGTFMDRETHRIREFQTFVSQNSLSASDSAALTSWIEERNILEFTISRDACKLLDISYGQAAHRQLWRFYHTVTFADGDADVSVYEGYDKSYSHFLLGLSIAAGFAACLGIFISSMQEDVAYIRRLQTEIAAISQGDLQQLVTVQGTDELAQLAYGLDQNGNCVKHRKNWYLACHMTCVPR